MTDSLSQEYNTSSSCSSLSSSSSSSMPSYSISSSSSSGSMSYSPSSTSSSLVSVVGIRSDREVVKMTGSAPGTDQQLSWHTVPVIDSSDTISLDKSLSGDNDSILDH